MAGLTETKNKHRNSLNLAICVFDCSTWMQDLCPSLVTSI